MSQDGISFGQWSIPDSELEETFDTPGGPGGQHANRNRTAVSLKFDILASSLPGSVKDRLTKKLDRTVIEVIASDSRSQWRNRALARQRLAETLEKAAKPDRQRRATRPSRASKERRLHAKQRKSEIKKQRQTPDIGD